MWKVRGSQKTCLKELNDARSDGERCDMPRVVSHTPSRVILVTGGARAGKSQFAQSLAESGPFRSRLYVATGVPCDGEMRARIARHWAQRDGRWATLEEPIRLPERLPRRHLVPGSVLLFDCLATFVTNLLLDHHRPLQVQRRVAALLCACRRSGVTTIVVSNEVGAGLVPETPLGRTFRDLLGTVNQQIARAADEVYLLVAGLPMRIK